jgi:hypothetical protein
MVMVAAPDGISAQEQGAGFSSWDVAVIETQTNTPTWAGVPDSVRVQSGYQHWRGALLGAGIGAALGALTGATAGAISSCYDCSRQPSAGSGALIVGLIGAGAGSVVGFLAGLSSPKYVWVPVSEGAP